MGSNTPPPPPPGSPSGWYHDPWRQAPQRYWDGSRWTGSFRTIPSSGGARAVVVVVVGVIVLFVVAAVAADLLLAATANLVECGQLQPREV